MKRGTRRLRPIEIAVVVMLCAVTSRAQAPGELDSNAKARIEQAGASIVRVRVESADQKISEALGFFVRHDLVVTDIQMLNENSRVRVTTATKDDMLKVLSAGNYFLPYVLVEKQSEISPLSFGDSERVMVNDSVYLLDDRGGITSGIVTGTTKIKGERAFLTNLPIDSNNKGAPIFNRNGGVIGIATQSNEGQGTGLSYPSSLLAKLKHLGEPGVGVGRGDGPSFQVESASTAAVTSASQVDKKPVRLSAPHPRYTEAARANGTRGTVTLRALVGADGDVKDVRVVRGLPDGLTEQAIVAARQAKFRPAMKDGKPVPFWISIDMEFNIR